MLGALAGLGLGAVGTGFQMYGAHEQNQAMSHALGAYNTGMNANLAAQQAQAQADAEFASQQVHQRQGFLTQALNSYTAGPQSAQPQADALNQLVTANQLKAPSGQPTGANAQWQAPLDAYTQQHQGQQMQLAADKFQQDAQRLAQEKAMSTYQIQGGQLDAQRADHSGLAALEKALRQREWMRQQGQFQLDMNGAHGAGGSSMQLGALLGATGGLVSSQSASNGVDPQNPYAFNTG